MNEKGNRYAISALKDKRATLAGEIHALKRKLAWLTEQVRHVDATLALFDPDIDPASLPLRKPRTGIRLFRQGELGRLIMDALREAERPLQTGEIVEAIMARKGYGEEARGVIRRRVTSNLAYRARRGEIMKGGDEGGPLWALQPNVEDSQFGATYVKE